MAIQQAVESNHSLDDTSKPRSDGLRSALLQTEPISNPVLQRLKARILAEVDASEVITSYDRMHHRHNRS